jgi:CheY-like chemotaxis protein
LGLGITQRSLDALGGTLEHRSRVGDGSVFWITFPANTPHHVVDSEHGDMGTSAELAQTRDTPLQSVKTPSSPVPRSLLSGKSVLIIEDHPTNQQLIAHMTTRLGCQVETADDGLQGLEKAFKTQFDLILTDINMPNLDGLDTATCIRTMSRSQYGCIVAVTAHANIDTNEDVHIFEHGIDGLISKPFTQEQLQDKLTKILEEHMELRPKGLASEEDSCALHDLLDMGLPADKAQALVDRACEDIRKVQSAITSALSSQDATDYVQLGTLAHHAAGGIYFLGGHGLGDTLIQIEKSCAKDDKNTLKGLQRVLDLAFSELEIYLKAEQVA